MHIPMRPFSQEIPCPIPPCNHRHGPSLFSPVLQQLQQTGQTSANEQRHSSLSLFKLKGITCSTPTQVDCVYCTVAVKSQLYNLVMGERRDLAGWGQASVYCNRQVDSKSVRPSCKLPLRESTLNFYTPEQVPTSACQENHSEAQL